MAKKLQLLEYQAQEIGASLAHTKDVYFLGREYSIRLLWKAL